MNNKVPISVVTGLAIAIILDTAVQLCWKVAASQAAPCAGLIETAATVLGQPIFYATVIMFIMQLVNWMKVLSGADLSYAQPITSLSYISVAFLSALWLKEILSMTQMAGICLILGGVFLISRTEHNTVAMKEGSD